MKLTDGKTSDFRTKRESDYAAIYGSWCSVCRKEMPIIERHLAETQNEPQLCLAGIDRDEPLETVLKFVEALK